MNNHVVSLDLAKKLKEAGYKQQAEFLWFSNLGSDFTLEYIEPMKGMGFTDAVMIAAPLATELLDQLPHQIDGYWLTIKKIGRAYYTAIYKDVDGAELPGSYQESDNLTDALAEMWLWLKENNYL